MILDMVGPFFGALSADFKGVSLRRRRMSAGGKLSSEKLTKCQQKGRALPTPQAHRAGLELPLPPDVASPVPRECGMPAPLSPAMDASHYDALVTSGEHGGLTCQPAECA